MSVVNQETQIMEKKRKMREINNRINILGKSIERYEDILKKEYALIEDITLIKDRYEDMLYINQDLVEKITSIENDMKKKYEVTLGEYLKLIEEHNELVEDYNNLSKNNTSVDKNKQSKKYFCSIQ